MKFLIAVALIGITAPAYSGTPTPPPPLGPVLWNGVRVGMSKATIRQMFPVSKGQKNSSDFFGGATGVPFDVVPDCPAAASISHSGGYVTDVSVSSLSTYTDKKDCPVTVEAGLRAKYGEPTETLEASEQTVRTGSRTNTTTPANKTLTWVGNGVTIIFLRSNNLIKDTSWSITYTPAASAAADASKL